MKRIVYLAMLMFSIVLLGSCEKDEIKPDVPVVNPIIGTWQFVSSEVSTDRTHYTPDTHNFHNFNLTFTADNKVVKHFNVSGTYSSDNIVYSWEINSIKLMTFSNANPSGFPSEVYNIIENTETTLFINTFNTQDNNVHRIRFRK